MPNFRQRLEKFVSLPIEQASHLADLIWQNEPHLESELEQLISDISSFYDSLTQLNYNSDNLNDVKIEQLPFLIAFIARGLIFGSQKKLSKIQFLLSIFIADLALPFIKNSKKIVVAIGKDEFNAIRSSYIIQLVHLLDIIEHKNSCFDQILDTLFADIPHDESLNTSTTKSLSKFKSKNSKKTHQWEIESDLLAIENSLQACKTIFQTGSILSKIDLNSRISQLISSCFDYLYLPSYQALYKQQIVHQLLPQLFSLPTSTDHQNNQLMIWNHVQKMYLNKNNGDLNQQVYAILVQFYELFFPVLNENSFDLRSQDLYFQIIQDGIVKSDLVNRKRSMYLLKRTIQSSSNSISVATSSFFSWNNTKHEDGTTYNSIWETYLLMMDAVDDGLVIMKSMWNQFDSLLGFCKTNQNTLSRDQKPWIHPSWLQTLVRKIFAADSRPLRKFILWSLLANYNQHSGSTHLFSDLNFICSILLQFDDIVSAHNAIKKPRIFHITNNFFRLCVASQDNIADKIALLKGLLDFCMLEKVHGQTILAFFRFLASENKNVLLSQDQSNTSNIGVFNDTKCLELINCFNSTFKGFIPDIQHALHRHSLQAVANWVDFNNTSPKTIIETIVSVPSFFASKPDINKALRSLMVIATEFNSEQSSTTKINIQQEWIVQFMERKVSEMFEGDDFLQSNSNRSSLRIRSFVRVETLANYLNSLLELLPLTVAHSCILSMSNICFSFLNTKFSGSSIVFLSILWYLTKNRNISLWNLLSETIVSNSTKTGTEPSNIIKRDDNKTDDDKTDDNKTVLQAGMQEIKFDLSKLHQSCFEALQTNMNSLTKEQSNSETLISLSKMNQSLFGSSMALALICSFDDSSTKLATEFLDLQTKFGPSTSWSPFQAYSHLGIYLVDSAFLKPDQIVDKMLEILNVEWPRNPRDIQTSTPIDGPTWKEFTSEYFISKYSAISHLASGLQMTCEDAQLTTKIKQIVQKLCDAATTSTLAIFPNLMKSVKKIMPLVLDFVDQDEFDEYLNCLIAAAKQEKTFVARSIYHFMAAIFTPSIIFNTKHSQVVVKWMNYVLELAQISTGIANWLCHLLYDAFNTDNITSPTKENFAIEYIPILFELVCFGPVRANGQVSPSNEDIVLAGYHGSMLDSHVRVLANILVSDPSMLGKYNLFTKRMMEFMIGQDENETDKTQIPIKANSLFDQKMENYASQKTRKCAISHLKNYRRYQTFALLSKNCANLPSNLISSSITLLFAEELVSVRDMISISTSVMIANSQSNADKILSELASCLEALQTKSKDEDLLFSVLAISGYALKIIDLVPAENSQQDMKQVIKFWKLLLQKFLPYLTFNSLYIRGTCHLIFSDLIKYKMEQIRQIFDDDFVEFLRSTEQFIKNILEIKTSNRSSRRELFFYEFLEQYQQKKSAEEVQQMMAQLVIVEHPKDSGFISAELISTEALHWYMNYQSNRDLDKYEEQQEEETFKNQNEISKFVEECLTGVSANNASDTDPNEPIPSQDEVSRPEIDQSQLAASQSQFQRKIVPWQTIDLSDSSSQNSVNDAIDMDKTKILTKRRQDLVIVATLLKKMPNFGGITRTAEIFAASKLIVPSLKIKEDKTFRDLSVTSEQWLPMEEVSESQLGEYLLKMRNEGYTLIGVEQTSNSCSLVDFEFPAKTLLLLGEERHGIPAEFIQILDECVEIPQFGVIRSLNVHVSASIMIWEYTKQHLQNQVRT